MKKVARRRNSGGGGGTSTHSWAITLHCFVCYDFFVFSKFVSSVHSSRVFFSSHHRDDGSRVHSLARSSLVDFFVVAALLLSDGCVLFCCCHSATCIARDVISPSLWLVTFLKKKIMFYWLVFSRFERFLLAETMSLLSDGVRVYRRVLEKHVALSIFRFILIGSKDSRDDSKGTF